MFVLAAESVLREILGAHQLQGRSQPDEGDHHRQFHPRAGELRVNRIARASESRRKHTSGNGQRWTHAIHIHVHTRARSTHVRARRHVTCQRTIDFESLKIVSRTPLDATTSGHARANQRGINECLSCLACFNVRSTV